MKNSSADNGTPLTVTEVNPLAQTLWPKFAEKPAPTVSDAPKKLIDAARSEG